MMMMMLKSMRGQISTEWGGGEQGSCGRACVMTGRVWGTYCGYKCMSYPGCWAAVSGHASFPPCYGTQAESETSAHVLRVLPHPGSWWGNRKMWDCCWWPAEPELVKQVRVNDVIRSARWNEALKRSSESKEMQRSRGSLWDVEGKSLDVSARQACS